MYHTLERRLRRLSDSGQLRLLSESKIGIEKESLRVAQSGGISQKDHPPVLGSALTNPYITTDFSEALTELITPPCDSIRQALSFLDDIQRFVYSNLDDETLWSTSMPCVVEGDDSIRIAEYGSSNSAKMKNIYRRGLSNRYGKTMQVIAGVHFNYSLSDDFWRLYQQLEGDAGSLQTFKSDRYMSLVRNILRFGWLIPYLFGASPAVCKSFVQGKPTMLSDFNENTFYEPYATSLRMGDIGYTNTKESMAGIKANYDSLEDYVDSLRCAISTPFQSYEEIGVKVDGVYRQLNSNILQIENEYYSTVRPKQILRGDEKPTSALSQRGVEYVELRSLDVNAFDPLGINEEQLYFLEVFVIFCLLHEGPKLSEEEINGIDVNLIQVAHSGREPGLKLLRQGEEVTLRDWALELCEAMRAVAASLDAANSTADDELDDHMQSLEKQIERVEDPEQTVSAHMLRSMREHDEGFFHFAQRMSDKHHRYFDEKELSEEKQAMFMRAVSDSIQKQRDIEAQETMSFDDFLQNYFANG